MHSSQDGSEIVAHRGADPNGWLSRARTASNTAWQDFFARSSVRLPQSPLTERFFYAALYLLRLSAGGSAPPGLYGPFVTTDRMAWAGDLHLNYNLQATYYGVVQAGHEELLASYYEPLLDYRPWGRIWARRIFNCSGLALPTGIAPFGNPADGGGWDDNGQRRSEDSDSFYPTENVANSGSSSQLTGEWL